jgi:hypothetical protein
LKRICQEAEWKENGNFGPTDLASAQDFSEELGSSGWRLDTGISDGEAGAAEERLFSDPSPKIRSGIEAPLAGARGFVS